MKQWMRRPIDALGLREFQTLAAVAAVVVGTWFFLEVVGEVTEGSTREIDRWSIQALRRPDNPALPIGPSWLIEAARDITALGGLPVLTLMTLMVAAYLYIRRLYGAMVLVLVATVGGGVLSMGLKTLFNRPRPDLVPHLSVVSSASFPSGHSMLSAVVYLTLGTLLARMEQQLRVKLYLLTVAMVVSFLVGISRVYLGVHYPSDVLAGWSAGLVWAMLCWLGARMLQRRGTVESGRG